MDSAEIVKEGIQINSSEGADPEDESNSVDDGETEYVKIQVINATSFESIFLY